MTNRKQKAMEEAYRGQSTKPRNKDTRRTLTEEEFEVLLKNVADSLEYGTTEAERNWWTTYYKNGAKMFDRAMILLNSPLMKALS